MVRILLGLNQRCFFAVLLFGLLSHNASGAAVVFNFETEAVGGLKAVGTLTISTSMIAVDGLCSKANDCIVDHTFTAPVNATTMVPLPGASVDSGAFTSLELTVAGAGTSTPSISEVRESFLSTGGGGFGTEALSLDIDASSPFSGIFYTGNPGGAGAAFTGGTFSTTAVPEPSSFLFLGLVIVGLGLRNRFTTSVSTL